MLRGILAACTLVETACGGGGSSVAPPGPPRATAPPGSTAPPGYTLTPLVASYGTGSCTVSFDGLLSYRVPAGAFAPIDVAFSRCSSGGAVSAQAPPVLPSWSHPQGPTQALVAVTSLQEAYSPAGMSALADIAHAHKLPVTWMIGNGAYISTLAGRYSSYNMQFGDDVQVEPDPSLIAGARSAFPWYVPSVSIEGAGRERNIARAQSFAETAFWGITWNSFGTDGTFDRGAPWGAYCADPTSYKRPAPDGTCAEVALEWTARDLTRAYVSGREDAFSTDPDDILVRGGFSTASGAAYEGELMDAYAAAGQSQPLVVVLQQESSDMELNPQDAPILDALYARAVADGMTPVTLAQAAVQARAFAAHPRAVAFPFITGGALTTSYRGSSFAPATIDYHDMSIGMTFVAGHTAPSRTFPYVRDPVSSFAAPLVEVDQPATLTRSAYANGALYFHFSAPAATRYGIALWSDPASLQLGAGAVVAGHAGVVVPLDLPAGETDISVPCGGCSSTTLPFST